MAKILVIEDETLVRENIVEVLSEIGGFDVLAAMHGRHGLELAEQHSPDLILCDVLMPEINGFNVLVNLQQNLETARIPFIFLTARASRESRRRGMTLGADDYITKPFDALELVQAVNSRLQKQAFLEANYEKRLDDLRHNIVLAMPHELRTPLVGILGGAEILRFSADSISPAELLEVTEMITTAGLQLERLIENYLIYAQIEIFASDAQKIKALRVLETSDPDAVVRESVAQAAHKFNRRIDLHLAGEKMALAISEEHFFKVLGELLDNALKFSFAETPVTIEGGLVDGMYQCTIMNEGRGMTVEEIEQIGAYMQFSRKFFEQQGSGLGLIISKRLVQLYGGELVIDSVPDQRTVVKLRIRRV